MKNTLCAELNEIHVHLYIFYSDQFTSQLTAYLRLPHLWYLLQLLPVREVSLSVPEGPGGPAES